MSENFEKELERKLEQGYEKMVKSVKSALQEAEEKTLPALNKAVEKAKEAAVEVGKLTKREAENLAEYVKKDLVNAAEQFETATTEFSEELSEEVKDVEAGFFYWMLTLADPAKIQLRDFLIGMQLEDFHAGEVTSAGTLECQSCGKQIHLEKTSHIPPCPECSGTEYKKC